MKKMPRAVKRRRRRKARVPARRRAEKTVIWEAHKDPVGFKFYGTFKPLDSKETKHFEFSVVTPRRMNRRAMYFFVKSVVRKMISDKRLPHGHYYHTYDGFMRLLTRHEWEKVEKVVTYNVRHTAT